MKKSKEVFDELASLRSSMTGSIVLSFWAKRRISVICGFWGSSPFFLRICRYHLYNRDDSFAIWFSLYQTQILFTMQNWNTNTWKESLLYWHYKKETYFFSKEFICSSKPYHQGRYSITIVWFISRCNVPFISMMQENGMPAGTLINSPRKHTVPAR